MAIRTGGSGLLIDCNVFSTDGLLDHSHSPVILLSKCMAAAKWPTDWTKEARLRLDMALAATQLEVNDILYRFSANGAPHATTRSFEKALMEERQGFLLSCKIWRLFTRHVTEMHFTSIRTVLNTFCQSVIQNKRLQLKKKNPQSSSRWLQETAAHTQSTEPSSPLVSRVSRRSNRRSASSAQRPVWKRLISSDSIFQSTTSASIVLAKKGAPNRSTTFPFLRLSLRVITSFRPDENST